MEKHNRILSVRDLRISFHTGAGEAPAVRGLNFDLHRGETLAIVGESGSGKSVTCKAIARILPENGRVESGSVRFFEEDGTDCDLLKLPKKEMRRQFSGKRIAMVFQNPLSSLDPTMTIGGQLTEGMRRHLRLPHREAKERARELLDQVGIREPERMLRAYPHQLSGGMRQRVVIAIALSCSPEVLICDEPTTALDVTIQERILELIGEIQRKYRLSVIYVTHDLSVVARIADRVMVMYAGKAVEEGGTEELFFDPRHPYTWGLMLSQPYLAEAEEKLYTIPGMPPNLTTSAAGDAFAPRNAYAMNIDYRLEPPMFPISDTHKAATWLLAPGAPDVPLPEQLRRRIESMRKEVGR